MSCLFAPRALLPDGWANDVLFEFSGDGTLAAVTPRTTASEAERAAGPVVPGLPNLHSHAFQRAMAGLAESRSAVHPEDSFWTWRETMYGLVERVTPEQLAAVAARLYAELLCSGFTSVAEFHYLHHGPGGKQYAQPAETSLHVVDAAIRTGLRITHLPVLYARGGFDGRALTGAQLRFRTDADSILTIRQAVADYIGPSRLARTGLALHSLRAVDAESLDNAIVAVRSADDTAPIHIHVAEQEREVRDCLAATGQRPVEWLLDHADVDRRWCLVHATHLVGQEIEGLAKSTAIAGLCPTTEANLGDGLFPLPRYLAHGGRIGIGTDSHVSRSATEELRWLEYGQRLHHQQRNLCATPDHPSVGAWLWRAACSGGAAALAQPIGALAPGHAADLVVLDGNHADLEAIDGEAILDTLVFGAADPLVRDVMVGAEWVVRQGRHRDEEAIDTAYRAALRALRGGGS